MINMKAFANFDGKKLNRIVAKGAEKALVKQAAFIRGMAYRKVKRRKYKSSPPGQPPYAHTGVFKASILYGFDRQNLTAYIGPQRLQEGRTNYGGKPIPNILEFGGDAALGMNALWIHKRAPRGLRDEPSIANYFRGLGKGPIAYGSTPAQVDRKAGSQDLAAAGGRRSTKTGKMKFKVHPKRFSPMKKKKVYLGYIRITTDKQARKVAKTVTEVFGYPATNKRIPIAPRPFMGPTLQEAKNSLAHFLANSIHGTV